MTKLSLNTWDLRPLNPETASGTLADAERELQRIEQEKKQPGRFYRQFSDVSDSVERSNRDLLFWKGHWHQAKITVDVDWKLGEKRVLPNGGWVREATLAGVTYRASVMPGQRVRLLYRPRGSYGNRWSGRVVGPNGETVFEGRVGKTAGVTGMLADMIALVVMFNALVELAR